MKTIVALLLVTVALIVITDVLSSIEMSYITSTVPAFVCQAVIVMIEERRRRRANNNN